MTLFSAVKLNAIQRAKCLPLAWIRAASSAAPQLKNITPLTYDKNPEKAFLETSNRDLMFNLTRMDLEKIYKQQPVKPHRVHLEFMTVEELQRRENRSLTKAMTRLQLPPVMQIESDDTEIISQDLALNHFSDAKVVITDVSSGLTDLNRTVLVRNTNGVLEIAPPAIRKRMNLVYFPQSDRKLTVPLLFSDQQCLQEALDKQLYEYILNRVCVQFEPFEKEFHRITSLTYHHLNETRNFEALRSTRFFGTLSFYLAWHKIIDNLLIDTLEKGYLDNAVEIIALMWNLNEVPYDNSILETIKNANKIEDESSPELEKILGIIESAIGRNGKAVFMEEACLKFVEKYVTQSGHATKSELNAVLQASKRQHAGRYELLKSLLDTHGIRESDL